MVPILLYLACYIGMHHVITSNGTRKQTNNENVGWNLASSYVSISGFGLKAQTNLRIQQIS